MAQIVYFASGVNLVLQALSIQEHGLNRLVSEQLKMLFGPLVLQGAFLIIVCIGNLHYLNGATSNHSENSIFRKIYQLINISVIFFAVVNLLSYLAPPESVFGPSIANSDWNGAAADYFKQQCANPNSVIRKLDLRYKQASFLICSEYCPCNEVQWKSS